MRSPLPVEFDVPDERLPPAIEAAAYYVAAEALANVAKYAGASGATVRVVEDEEAQAIVVEVTDDGVGGADPARGSGLEGLEDRVESLDGTFEIESPPGGGTRIRATIPICSPCARITPGRGFVDSTRVQLPTGTVTFLFADVEGSTKLVQTVGAAYPGLIADVRRLLRAEIAANGGAEVDATGDELSAVFEEAHPALRAALAGQGRIRDHTWPDGIDVQVRMGLHTGVPQLGEEGYTGLDVIRASRIAAAGHGGQILLSSTAAPVRLRRRDPRPRNAPAPGPS